MADLQAQLSEKQSELQALSLENMALAAKARALEQLVKSAGGRILLCFAVTESLCTGTVTADVTADVERLRFTKPCHI